MSTGRITIPFRDIDLASLAEVGGKNASLGELLRSLSPSGVRVPDGFAITAKAFHDHLAQDGTDKAIYAELEHVNVRDVTAVARAGTSARERVRAMPLPRALRIEISAAYDQLSHACHDLFTDVAVRSSATAADLPSASFAGQHDSYLNVRGRSTLLTAVRDCMASLFTDRAIVYRAERGFRHRDVALSVGVQKMVRSDLASAGVMFTLDTESGHDGVVTITGSWGLGTSVVKGRVNPDEIWALKQALDSGWPPIIGRRCGDKAVKLVYGPGASNVIEQPVTDAERRTLVLTDVEAVQLARWAVAIEAHYSARAGRPTPMAIEWAKDGRSGELFIVQARPETIQAQKRSTVTDDAPLDVTQRLASGARGS